MEIYLDTEFTDFAVDSALISIGFVSVDGKEFYAELNDTYCEDKCSDFVIENVLPILNGKAVEISWNDLAPKLKTWIESFDEPATLWADGIEFDWAWIIEIFSNSKCGWPGNMARGCNSTGNLAADEQQERYYRAYEDFWLENQARGAVQHHALWDARCILHAHQQAVGAQG